MVHKKMLRTWSFQIEPYERKGGLAAHADWSGLQPMGTAAQTRGQVCLALSKTQSYRDGLPRTGATCVAIVILHLMKEVPMVFC